jgi:hypothetical protein
VDCPCNRCSAPRISIGTILYHAHFRLSAPKQTLSAPQSLDSGFVPPSTIQSETILPPEPNVRDFNMHPQDQYHPAFFPSTTTYAPTVGGIQSPLDRLHIPPWQSGYPNSGYYSLPLTPSRATFSHTYQVSPGSASPERQNFIPHDSVLRQGPRQRTAHACEKCRQRKTKVGVPISISTSL